MDFLSYRENVPGDACGCSYGEARGRSLNSALMVGKQMGVQIAGTHKAGSLSLIHRHFNCDSSSAHILGRHEGWDIRSRLSKKAPITQLHTRQDGIGRRSCRHEGAVQERAEEG
jgi:hypothetical protein